MGKTKLDGQEYDLSNKEERDAYWNAYAAKQLAGKRIISVRYMSETEAENLGWHQRALVLELEGGVLLYPSQDDEGNGAGALFGQVGKKDLIFPVI